jgi:hypothetical protein
MEKEKRAPRLWQNQHGIGRTVIRKNRDVRWLFPLLGGEGQDEGGRSALRKFSRRTEVDGRKYLGE